MNEVISKTDLDLFTRSQAMISMAQEQLVFASNHIIETYGINPQDLINFVTGEITRVPESEAEITE